MTTLRDLILLVLYVGLGYAVYGLVMEFRSGRKPPYDKW